MTSTDAPAASGREAAGPVTPRFFDVGLRLDGRDCLVVGGGRIAGRKAALLAEAGAVVTVVAPALDEVLGEALAAGRVARWEPRAFEGADVAGRALVVAATDDAGVNQEVAAACRERGVWVNVVDAPELCDFVVPATVRRGPLHLAVSTSGLAPALAAGIVGRLGEAYPEVWGDVVTLLGRQREEARARGLDESARRGLARDLAALEIDELLADGGIERVREAVAACVARYAE